MAYDLNSLRRHVAKIEPRLSRAELGELLAPCRTSGRAGTAYTRCYICELESGAKPFTADVLEAIAGFIVHRVSAAMGASVSVRARMRGRRRKFQAVRQCALCRKWFVTKRSNQTKCRQCRQRHRV